MERTFSIIKPDATRRNITGSINKIIEKGTSIHDPRPTRQNSKRLQQNKRSRA